MYADEVLLPWFEAAWDAAGRPPLLDAHTHFGSNDPDGYGCSPEELLESLELAHCRGVVFPMHEPGGYSHANDSVMAEAARSDGRLVPFCRVDPHTEPLAELERCLDAGARGVKLHPRSDAFELGTGELDDFWPVADERRLPVLVHAGRGIPALGTHAADICERWPGVRLILAHCGLSDLSWLVSHVGRLPNLFFDTSWWSPADIVALMALVPPGQVLMGSDVPYGTPVLGSFGTLRIAEQLGYTDEQVRLVMGEQMQRLVDWQEPADAGPAVGERAFQIDLLLDRVHTHLCTAITTMFRGGDATEQLANAQLGCIVDDDQPHAATCRALSDLIDQVTEYGVSGGPSTSGVHVAVAAAIVARTPDVALP